MRSSIVSSVAQYFLSCSVVQEYLLFFSCVDLSSKRCAELPSKRVSEPTVGILNVTSFPYLSLSFQVGVFRRRVQIGRGIFRRLC